MKNINKNELDELITKLVTHLKLIDDHLDNRQKKEAKIAISKLRRIANHVKTNSHDGDNTSEKVNREIGRFIFSIVMRYWAKEVIDELKDFFLT